MPLEAEDACPKNLVNAEIHMVLRNTETGRLWDVTPSLFEDERIVRNQLVPTRGVAHAPIKFTPTGVTEPR